MKHALCLACLAGWLAAAAALPARGRQPAEQRRAAVELDAAAGVRLMEVPEAEGRDGAAGSASSADAAGSPAAPGEADVAHVSAASAASASESGGGRWFHSPRKSLAVSLAAAAAKGKEGTAAVGMLAPIVLAPCLALFGGIWAASGGGADATGKEASPTDSAAPAERSASPFGSAIGSAIGSAFGGSATVLVSQGSAPPGPPGSGSGQEASPADGAARAERAASPFVFGGRAGALVSQGQGSTPPGPGSGSGQAPSIYLGETDPSALCAELMVVTKNGAMLFLDGEIESYQQDDMLTLRKSDHGNEPLLFAYMSETHGESGILLETCLQNTFGFLKTTAAVAKQGQPMPKESLRHMPILRFNGRQANPRGLPYAVVEADQAGHHAIVHGCTPTGDRGPIMLQVYRSSSHCLNLVCPNGVLLATVDEIQVAAGKKNFTRRIFRIAPGCDVALLMCAVIGLHKLR